MRSLLTCLVAIGAVAAATAAPPQNAPDAAPTDIYHVHFTKSVPGQAAAHGKSLMTPDKTQSMPEHFVVLRHQEGDDWDYVVIQHLGPKAQIAITPPPPPAGSQPPLTAWHSDTFVAGPSWGEFTKQMGIGAANAANQVYIVGVHRHVPGHREQLLKSLSAPGPASKIESGNVLLQHIEGSEWTFATLTRYNSWQDLATDRAGAASSQTAAAGGWADIREHSAFHRDTIAGRIYPAK